jgi:chromosome segregation ATPase
VANVTIELLSVIVGALTSLLAAGIASSEQIRNLVRSLFRVKEGPPKSYSQRLSELTGSLTKASSEVDAILVDLTQVARDREVAVQKLEFNLADLENQEKDLKERIETLEKTPLPVAQHFAKLLESGERRSLRHGYLLFGAGVLVTTVITVIIQVALGK